MSVFVEELPPELRKPLSMLIYKDLYTNVAFLKGKHDNFISWICPLMKSRVALPNENIYYENDELRDVFFLK